MKNLLNQLEIQITREKSRSQPPLCKDHLDGLYADRDISFPIKRLPNVRRFLIRNNQADPLLKRYGILKKLNPEMEFKELSWKIKASNRYISIMNMKLGNLLKQKRYTEFWHLACSYMLRSKVLKIVALRKLESNWHDVFEYSQVDYLLKRLQAKIRTLSTKITIARMYVPKGDSWRPVGNPRRVDRMYSYLWQSFITMHASTFVGSNQHAYFPGFGVGSCLDMLAGYLNDPEITDIWEFDLKGAFPSTKIRQTVAAFENEGLPTCVGDFLIDLSEQTIERVDMSLIGQKLPEQKYDDQRAEAFRQAELKRVEAEMDREDNYHTDDEFDPDFLRKTMDQIKSYEDGRFPNRGTLDKVEGLYITDRNMIADNVRRDSEGLPDLFRPNRTFLQEGNTLGTGFPQGLGISPIMFNIAFEMGICREWFHELGCTVVSYADDFLVFAHSQSAVPTDWWDLRNSFGFKVSKEKSRQIKKDGKWLVDNFKYLGVTISLPKTEEEFAITGTPRSGKMLKMDPLKVEMEESHNRRDIVLEGISRELNWNLTPEEIMDQWGMSQLPGAIIPIQIIAGDPEFNTWPLPEGIVESIGRSLEDSNEADYVPKELTIEEFTDVDSPPINLPGEMTSSERELVDKYITGSPLNFLGRRLAGLILSKLHGGTWHELELNPDRPGSVGDSPSSFVNIIPKSILSKGFKRTHNKNTQVRSLHTIRTSLHNLNDYNRSSYCVLGLINLMSGQMKYIKNLDTFVIRPVKKTTLGKDATNQYPKLIK